MTVHLPAFISKMKSEGLPPLVIDTFSYYYNKVITGDTGMVYDRDIQPVKPDEIEDFFNLNKYANAGTKVLHQTVRIVLNGGLGTSMGLLGPKSLIEVKNGNSFLDIILKQAEGHAVKLAFMNSFSTQAATEEALRAIGPADPPLMFIQNRFPKILRDSLLPASWPANPELEWNPPGHGDVYTAMATSGILDRLLEADIRYALICNSDNLGATMDEPILGYLVRHDVPFLMEVARRTPADAKGGHLAVDGKNNLLLRESAQFPADSQGQDIDTYCFFNTNNLWLNLSSLKKVLAREKTLRLPLADYGTLLILHVEDTTATALVTYAEKNIAPGDAFRAP